MIEAFEMNDGKNFRNCVPNGLNPLNNQNLILLVQHKYTFFKKTLHVSGLIIDHQAKYRLKFQVNTTHNICMILQQYILTL
jgi:hypothetical protein